MFGRRVSGGPNTSNPRKTRRVEVVFGLDSPTRFTSWKLKSEPKGYQREADFMNAADSHSTKWKLVQP
jgi:hypothetical protein